MHPVQREYVEAKQAFDEAAAQVRSRMEAHADLMDEDFDRYLAIEAEVADEVGMEEARQRYVQAEAELLRWGRAGLERHPDYVVKAEEMKFFFRRGLEDNLRVYRRAAAKIALAIPGAGNAAALSSM